MIAIEVSLNDEFLAVAGAADLSVLSAIISASGKLGPESHGTKGRKEDNRLYLRVGGLTSRGEGVTDEHPIWVDHETLSVGDCVTVRIVDVLEADSPVTATSAGENINETNERRWYEMAKQAYFDLKDKFE